MRCGPLAVAHQPFRARSRDEEVLRDVEFVALADLDGLSFDEPSALQGAHGVAGEMSAVAGPHLQAEIARAETDVGGPEVDDRQRHYFIGDQIVRGSGNGSRRHGGNVTL